MAGAACVLRRRATHLLVSKLRLGAAARAAGSAHRPAEPRPAGRPHRAGARALAPHRPSRSRCFVVDLDGFKGVNDVRGHEAGNDVLRTIARRLESVVRGSRHGRARRRRRVRRALARHGSDDEAAALVGRLRNALRRPYRVEGGLVELDASIGWALFPQDGLTPRSCSRAPTARCTRRSATRATSRRPAAAARRRRRARPRVRARARRDRRPLPADRRHQHGRDPRRRGARPARARRPARRPVGVRPAPRAHAARPHADARGRGRRARAPRRMGRRGHRLDAAVNVPYRMLDDPDLVAGSPRSSSAPRRRQPG